MKLQWAKIRNSTLFLSGLAGVAHETIITASERPSLLIVFTAMMGLPAVIGRDESTTPPPSPPSQDTTEATPPEEAPQPPSDQSSTIVDLLQDPVGTVTAKLSSRRSPEGG